MAVIATDVNRFSNLVKHEYEPAVGYTREVVTVNVASLTTLKAGQVMGIVTASGKWVPAADGAADGSQNAAGVYIGTVAGDFVDLSVPATTDTKVLVLRRGPAVLAAEQLQWSASYNTQAKKDAAIAALAALGIVTAPQK